MFSCVLFFLTNPPNPAELVSPAISQDGTRSEECVQAILSCERQGVLLLHTPDGTAHRTAQLCDVITSSLVSVITYERPRLHVPHRSLHDWQCRRFPPASPTGSGVVARMSLGHRNGPGHHNLTGPPSYAQPIAHRNADL